MINLLPPQEKKELLEKRRFRLTIILGIVFVSSFISLCLLLLLVKSYITLDIQTKEVLLEEQKRIVMLNQEIEKEIRESNTFLSNIEAFYEENRDVSGVLEKINQNLPSQTYLTSFTIATSKIRGEEKTNISISGYCASRDALVEFKESLEKEEVFAEVNFSPGSWVTPEEFVATFQLK